MTDTIIAESKLTLMRKETLEVSSVVARMLSANSSAFTQLGERLRTMDIQVVCTCARGSSDHAASYGKYLIETMVGLPVASIAPSVASVFAAPVRTRDAVCIAISQSGRSPDLLSSVDAYRSAAVPLIALVNDGTSPLAEKADWHVPLHAGTESSVAATKSCIAAMAAMAAITAEWSDDQPLRDAVVALPALLARAVEQDWSAAVEPLANVERMLVIGRGYSFGIAQEAGLKLKETCSIQAEPFSAAEVRHGPMTIVGAGFPILAFATSDAAGDDVIDVAAMFEERGAMVFDTRAAGGGKLATEATHPAIEPILMLASFYGLAEQLSRRRGLNPDAPLHLSKVTNTR